MKVNDFTLEYVISGGQTGADRGGYDAALKLSALGILPGGWVPKGRRAEDGTVPASYASYWEHVSDRYPPRTEQNVKDADVTVIITPMTKMTPGSRQTAKYARNNNKPYLHIDASVGIIQYDTLREFLEQHKPRVLNVAGTRESKARGIQFITAQIVTHAIIGWHNSVQEIIGNDRD